MWFFKYQNAVSQFFIRFTTSGPNLYFITGCLVCRDEQAAVCQWVSLQHQSSCGRQCGHAGQTRFWDVLLVAGILLV
jgi:hypothetical protein